MARVKGPLMSMEASGSVGNSVTFSRWKGRPYVRRHTVPANPKSPKQTSVRAMLRWLSQWWVSIDPADQATWEPLAAADSISPFNAYVRFNLARWGHALPPTKAYPPTATSTAPSAPTLTATAGDGLINLTLAKGTNNADWGWQIHRGLAPGVTPGPDNLVDTRDYTGSGADPWSDSPLPAGHYYYKARGLMSDGKFGANSAEVDAVVA